jgi:hypothetical protein
MIRGRDLDQIKVCPSCKFANPIDSTICARCKINLVPLLTARLTPSVPRDILEVSPPNHEHLLSKLKPETLLFVIVGQEQPIYVAKSTRIMLGREIPSHITPQITLDPQHAFYFGVSREHAVIECSNGACYIRDLESTNGTWVNERSLIPNRAYRLNSGDLIRLGQLGIYVYFRAERITQMNCVVTDARTTFIELTPEYLTSTLGPYLITLSKIQGILDVALERTQLVFIVRAIHMDAHAETVYLDLLVNDEFLDFLESSVRQWREQHKADIRSLWQVEENMDWRSAAVRKDSFVSRYAELRDKLHPALTQLVHQFLSELAPELQEQDKVTYTEKLLPVFYQLVHSPLHITRQSVVEVAGKTSM